MANELGRMSYYADWDYFASMAKTLRTYLFDYHTVPTWNLMLCGGKPELANPQSWAYTWPSLFVYALPPYPALLAIWLLLTVTGFWSMGQLLKRWGASPAAAWSGACLYAFNGYFASHFNQGHVSFASFHLIPLWALALDQLMTHAPGKSRILRVLAAIGVGVAFFTAGLPHALFYFSPWIVLLTAFVVGREWKSGPNDADKKPVLRNFATAVLTVVAALVLSAYKLWPVVAWQMKSPRQGVVGENLSILDVFRNTWQVHSHDMQCSNKYFASQVWCPWEYNAYIGPQTWFLAACAFGLWIKRRSGRAANEARHGSLNRLAALGVICVALGLNASLGNENPFSITRVFASLPLASGIRVFSRYQILTIVGMAMISAWSFDQLQQLWIRSRFARVANIALAITFCGPALVQYLVRVSSVGGETYADSAQYYSELLASQPQPSLNLPLFAHQHGSHEQMRQTFLLDHNYWVKDCFEPLALDQPQVHGGVSVPLSEPAPEEIAELTGNTLELLYAPGKSGTVALNLNYTPTMDFNVPVRLNEQKQLTFQAEDLVNGSLLIHQPANDEEQGLMISMGGLLIMMLWLLLAFRTLRRNSSLAD